MKHGTYRGYTIYTYKVYSARHLDADNPFELLYATGGDEFSAFSLEELIDKIDARL